jgi:RNA polymerase sigma-70 factor (ECF subfamily)
MTRTQPVADALLLHAGFVRRLARGLAGSAGDDLAQDACTAALASPSRGLLDARAWLSTVVRNLWRNTRRGQARRAAHEAIAAQAGLREGEPSVAAIVEREEVRQRVVAAVLALPERLRQVVLLRFYEDLDSRAIGERLGVPSSTVRTRLQQALAVLQQRLDAAHGSRRAWAAPLAAWLPASPPPLLPPLLRASWPLRVAAAAVAVVLAWFALPPLWSAPPALRLDGAPLLAANEPEADERQGPATTREQPAGAAAAAATTPARGPEHLWGRVVVGVDGAPVQGAEVVLSHRPADEFLSLEPAPDQQRVVGRVLTGADGAFEFAVPRARQHRLAVRAAGYAPVEVLYCTGGSEFVVRLDRSGYVEGIVRDAADFQPLADVLVEVVARDGSGEPLRVRTASDGTFFLGGVWPQPCYVRVRAAGRPAPLWQEVAVAPGGGARAEFVVGRGRVATGVVRDADTGLPVEGARVGTAWSLGDAVSTGPDGGYRIDGLGTSGALHVRAAGYADIVQTLPRAGDPLRLDFALERGSALTGRVVRADGGTARDVVVAAAAEELLGSGGAQDHWRPAVVAPDGRFRITGLAPARAWQLFARAEDGGARVWSLPAGLLRTGDVDLGDLALDPPGVLEGRFVDAAGAPIARAEVSLHGAADGFGELLPDDTPSSAVLLCLSLRHTRTGSDGTFRFGGLGAGSYQVSARLDGKDWTVDSGPHAVASGALVAVPDLVADPGLSIEGRVPIALLRGLPAGERLMLHAAGSDEVRQARIAADGTFVVDCLQPGEHRVFATEVPRGLALVPRSVLAGSKDVQLELVPADAIEGRVVDADGRPQAGVSVHFFPTGVPFARPTSTDADGRFRLEVPPGVTGKLGAADPEHRMRQVQVADVAAGARNLELRLPAR